MTHFFFLSKKSPQTNLKREDIQKAHRYIKKCSASLTIREMLVKTPVRSHPTPNTEPGIKKTRGNKDW